MRNVSEILNHVYKFINQSQYTYIIEAIPKLFVIGVYKTASTTRYSMVKRSDYQDFQ